MVDSKVIGIFSGKGGVGKTTITANLGAALAHEFDKRALIIDSNVKTSHLGIHFGVYDEFPVTLREVLYNRVPPIYAIYLHPASGLRLLPAPMKDDSVLRNIGGIVSQLRRSYDLILIDCSPGLGSDVIIVAKAVDSAIIVTTPDLPAFTDALKTIDLMKRLRKDILGIVLNRVRNEKYELTVKEIEQTSGQQVIAIIHETTKVPESIANGSPLVMGSNSRAAEEFKMLAAAIAGEKYVPSGFLGMLAGIFKPSANGRKVPKSGLEGFVKDSAVISGEAGGSLKASEGLGTEIAWKRARRNATYITPRKADRGAAAEDEMEAVENIRSGLAAGARLRNVGPYMGFERSNQKAANEMPRKPKAHDGR